MSDVIRLFDKSVCTWLRAQYISANDPPPPPHPGSDVFQQGFCIFRLIFTACHRIGRHRVYFFCIFIF